MADVSSNDRILPCLLDRLSDNNPSSTVEGRGDREVSMTQYRNGVMRDLSWLRNSGAHLEHEPIGGEEEVKDSVLNFGVRDLSGLITGSLDAADMKRHIAERLKVFEPRLVKDKLKVEIVDTRMLKAEDKHKLMFEITGELWANPMPEQFMARTEFDVENGHCRLVRV